MSFSDSGCSFRMLLEVHVFNWIENWRKRKKHKIVNSFSIRCHKRTEAYDWSIFNTRNAQKSTNHPIQNAFAVPNKRLNFIYELLLFRWQLVSSLPFDSLLYVPCCRSFHFFSYFANAMNIREIAFLSSFLSFCHQKWTHQMPKMHTNSLKLKSFELFRVYTSHTIYNH